MMTKRLLSNAKTLRDALTLAAKKFVHEEPTVVGGQGEKGWQAAWNGSIVLISHSLVTMSTCVLTEAEWI